MKTHFCLLALLGTSAALQAADPVSDAVTALGMLPNQRAGLHITADERNPFAVKPKDLAKATAPEDTETQESKIRAIFKQLRVTGVRRDRSGRAVALAGDLILRQGEEVKPVLEDQTETLIVSKIEPNLIELTFVEDKDSTQPRVIPLPVRNQVQVSQKLFGQPKGKAGFYVARGRTATDVEEAAAAIAATPPTAPASSSPVAAASTGGSVVAADPARPRDPRREAAALAGLSDPALAEMAGSGGSTQANGPSGESDATPPPPAAPAPAAAPAGLSTAGESAPPPTHARRRSAPPTTEQPPPPAGTSVVE